MLALSVTLTPLLASANSTPVRMDRDPVFAITPLLDTPLAVAREKLTFEVGQYSSSKAIITAQYQIENPSAEALTVPMVFPSISEGDQSFRPQITLNGAELEYEIWLAGSVSVDNYFDNPQGFTEQVDINSILSVLNEPLYQPARFKATDRATLYEVTLGGTMDRQSTISFEFDPSTTKVLSSSHQGYQGSVTPAGLQVTLSRYVGPHTIGEQMSILVIGEDSVKGLAVSSGDTLVKMDTTVEDFLKERMFEGEESWPRIDRYNFTNLYSAILRELDISWSQEEPFEALRPRDDVVHRVFSRNNLSVFLFTVEIPPESTNSLTVTYPVAATIDRSASADYVNTYAYILNPARNFADFGTLDIEIRLNEHSPFILESSIPLETNESGLYFASLQGLPDVDLVFSTYPKPEITPLDTLRGRIGVNRYPLTVLLVVFGFFFMFTVILVTVRWAKRAMTNEG